MRKNIKTLGSCLLILVAPAGANSQIVYHDINPDKVVNFSQYEINISCSPDSCQMYPSQNVKVSMMSGGGWLYWQSDARALVDVQNRAVALSLGQPIDASGSWSANGEALLNNGAGNWVSVSNKYLGIKILKSGQWHYGWVRMDVGSNGTYGVVKDYAFNAQPNAPLAAGQLIATGTDDLDKLKDVAVYMVGKAAKVEGLKDKGVIKLFNLEGKVVKEVLLEHNMSIDLSHMAPGVYVAHIITNTERKSVKLLVN